MRRSELSDFVYVFDKLHTGIVMCGERITDPILLEEKFSFPKIHGDVMCAIKSQVFFINYVNMTSCRGP